TSNTSFTNAGTINVTVTDSQRRHTTTGRDWSTDVRTSDLTLNFQVGGGQGARIFTGDLVNSGTVAVNYDATFNKSTGTYTNTGRSEERRVGKERSSKRGTQHQKKRGTVRSTGR